MELLIYGLNKKTTNRLNKIIYSQIIENLTYTVNSTAKKILKESEAVIFIHYIKKIEEKLEVVPSIDVSTLIPKVSSFII